MAHVRLAHITSYTCERVINDPDALYNDGATWDWQIILGTLASRVVTRPYKARTSELSGILDGPGMKNVQR